MSSSLIFTATYNEIKNIEKYLFLVNKYNKNVDILIIDDNSPDGTGKKLLNLKKKYKNLFVIIRKKKLGLDTAHKLAYNYSIKKKYHKLITMDADLSHDPKVISSFLKKLNNSSFIVGSRYIPGGKCDMEGFRLFLSIVGNKFIKTIFNINCNDYTSGYRGFNLKKLKNFNLNEITSKGYSFFMETIYQLNQKKINIKQIPIYFPRRKHGKSKIPRVELFRTFINVIILYLKR